MIYELSLSIRSRGRRTHTHTHMKKLEQLSWSAPAMVKASIAGGDICIHLIVNSFSANQTMTTLNTITMIVGHWEQLVLRV